MSIENPKQLSFEQKQIIIASIEAIKKVGNREKQALESLVYLKPLLEEINYFIQIPDNDECWGFPSIDQILIWTDQCVRGNSQDVRLGNIYQYVLDTLEYIVENH